MYGDVTYGNVSSLYPQGCIGCPFWLDLKPFSLPFTSSLRKYRLSGLKPASPSFSLLVFCSLSLRFFLSFSLALFSPVTDVWAVPSPLHPHFCASRSLVLKVVCVYSTENLKNYNIFNFQESDKSSNR